MLPSFKISFFPRGSGGFVVSGDADWLCCSLVGELDKAAACADPCGRLATPLDDAASDTNTAAKPINSESRKRRNFKTANFRRMGIARLARYLCIEMQICAIEDTGVRSFRGR